MTELRLEGVSFDYPEGVRALDGVDLLLGAGESVALVGANGCGKTTLLRHLDGLLRPTEGRVLHDGEDVRGLRVAQLSRRVGLCFQQPDRQIFARSVRDEVEFGARRHGVEYEEAFTRAKEALAAVDMEGELGTHPADLGEARCKLLTIASVLAMRTPVVAFDEPTTGLDRLAIGRVQGVIADLRDDGRTVIAASHDMRFVAETFERVVVMAAGRITLDGAPAEVFAEDAWPTLRDARIEPPAVAVLGARLGLGSTPTDDAFVAAVSESMGSSR